MEISVLDFVKTAAKRKQRHFYKETIKAFPHAKRLNTMFRSNAHGKDRRVTLHYTKANGEEVTREVTPMGARGIVMHAFDHHRGETRSFRLDRIQKMVH